MVMRLLGRVLAEDSGRHEGGKRQRRTSGGGTLRKSRRLNVGCFIASALARALQAGLPLSNPEVTGQRAVISDADKEISYIMSIDEI